ncbi:MAG: hypothetical protein QXU65_04275 [Sulfolobales archaeon]
MRAKPVVALILERSIRVLTIKEEVKGKTVVTIINVLNACSMFTERPERSFLPSKELEDGLNQAESPGLV